MSPPVSYLYAHVPFCPAKCSYCAFVTHVGSLKLLDPYIAALKLEADRLWRRRPCGPLQTVFFGGGTPSLMSPGQLASLLAHFDRRFGLAQECEITIETHPETVDPRKLAGFREAGATRISFGAESFNSQELAALGRSEHVDRVEIAILAARKAGFPSIGLDLIYGIPEQSLPSWEGTLRRALLLGTDHLSLYPLSIEPGTVFGRRHRDGTLVVPQDDAVVEMYSLACDLLRGAGYQHYEVANWSRPGHRCRHNLAYWRAEEFYAIGVGAHGYLRPYRTENMRQTIRYIQRLAAGLSPVAARETLDRRAELSEAIMLRLRLLQDGLDLDEMQARFGLELSTHFASEIQELSSAGMLRLAGRTLSIPEAAAPLANEVWQRFV